MMRVEGLRATSGGRMLLHGVDLCVGAGERIALVGASGSGKSLTARAMLALPPAGVRLTGAVLLEGRDLLRLSERALRRVRGAEVAMVFQEPATALNPVKRIGTQMSEPLRLHTAAGAEERADAVHDLLRRTGLAAAGVGPERYPHELSGGQRQRVALAIALALSPRLIVADEPTSALDAVTAAAVLDELVRLSGEAGSALVLITHDLAVARRAQRVVVMGQGRIAEEGGVDRLATPRSAAGRALLSDRALKLPSRPPPSGPAVLSVRGLTVRRGGVVAVHEAAFDLRAGERLALVGGSGSGKTTLARALCGLVPKTGEVLIDGVPADVDDVRENLAMVFQDPATSFNPRHSVRAIVTEQLHRSNQPAHERLARAREALERVGLPPDALDRGPHAFSGGQRQRIAIARALVGRPRVLIADEAVSALDAALRAQVVALFDRLVREDGLALLFIAHDLALVRRLADRVLVMEAGRIVEAGTVRQVFSAPRSAAGRALVDEASEGRTHDA